jgi:hypothetical protein
LGGGGRGAGIKKERRVDHDLALVKF